MNPETTVMLILGAPSLDDAVEELKRFRAECLDEAQQIAIECDKSDNSAEARYIAAEIEKLKGQS